MRRAHCPLSQPVPVWSNLTKSAPFLPLFSSPLFRGIPSHVSSTKYRHGKPSILEFWSVGLNDSFDISSSHQPLPLSSRSGSGRKQKIVLFSPFTDCKDPRWIRWSGIRHFIFLYFSFFLSPSWGNRKEVHIRLGLTFEVQLPFHGYFTIMPGNILSKGEQLLGFVCFVKIFLFQSAWVWLLHKTLDVRLLYL